jgi:hypothetical protein
MLNNALFGRIYLMKFEFTLCAVCMGYDKFTTSSNGKRFCSTLLLVSKKLARVNSAASKNSHMVYSENPAHSFSQRQYDSVVLNLSAGGAWWWPA